MFVHCRGWLCDGASLSVGNFEIMKSNLQTEREVRVTETQGRTENGLQQLSAVSSNRGHNLQVILYSFYFLVTFTVKI